MASSAKKYVLGKDIDLDREVVRDARGRRISSKRAEKIAEEVIVQVVGRPSLTGPTKVSPEIKARVPEKLKIALEREAKRQGQTPSALIRQALEDFLDTA
jgi:predicted HicB family RNase H-like nuclease